MKIGIDSIAFSTSKYFLSLETLAKHRNVDYAKYCLGIGQSKMSVFPPNEDIVTIAIDAAQKAISRIDDKNDIDMLIFATESSIDLSKSEGIYVHHFLNLKEDCRVFDLKQACYSAAAALQLARSYVIANSSSNPDSKSSSGFKSNSKVLVIGSDIMRYPLGTSGEPTQGGAAVAFIVSLNPRILEIEPHAGIHTTDIMDFWRPANLNEAMLNGKMSAYNYLKSMNICVARYFEKTNLTISDINHICFHAPFGKMAQKANNQLAKHKSINDTLIYNAVIGNSCSASIFICFISLLDHINENLTGQRIGFFSYGSGSVAEFFSGIISENYKQMLRKEENQMMLSDRIEISMSEYESFSRVGSEPLDFHKYKNVGNVALDTITNYQRIYLCHE